MHPFRVFNKTTYSALFVFTLLGIISLISIQQLYAATANVQTTVTIAICGNNVQEGSEDCDNSDLAGQMCSDVGYTAGTLSCSSACEFDVSLCTGKIEEEVPPPPSSGGGGSSSQERTTAVDFSGTAYPNARVVILKDATELAETRADMNGKYDIFIPDISPGVQSFSIQAYGVLGAPSIVESITVDVEREETTLISGTLLPPTIATNVAANQANSPFILLNGQGAPNSRITVEITGPQNITRTATTNAAGIWSIELSTENLLRGIYRATAQVEFQGVASNFSYPLLLVLKDDTFEIQNIEDGFETADINDDGRVNLVDVSILTYWKDRENIPDEVDLIKDGVIDLRDYSFCAYYWTS